MKKISSMALVVFILMAMALINVFASDTAFTLAVSGPSEFLDSTNINIVIKVNDITLSGGMSYVSFRLYYDTSKVAPLIKNGFTGDTENRKTFITHCPNYDTWEVIGILDENSGFYELTFGTDNITMLKTATNDGDLVFTVPFSIIKQTEEDLLFYVPKEYVEGGNKDLSQIEIRGKANDVSVKKHSSANSSEVEAESGNDESSDTTDPFELVENALITISDGIVNGLTDNMTVEQIKAMFKRNVTVSGVGTGATIRSGGKIITIVIKGDISGDGKIDAKDYMFAKKAFLGTYNLSAIQLKAACFEGTALPTAKDYMKIKRHFLGNFNIFKN